MKYYIHEEIKNRLNSGNIYHKWVQNFFVFISPDWPKAGGFPAFSKTGATFTIAYRLAGRSVTN
jgi:hypothetical protein